MCAARVQQQRPPAIAVHCDAMRSGGGTVETYVSIARTTSTVAVRQTSASGSEFVTELSPLISPVVNGRRSVQHSFEQCDRFGDAMRAERSTPMALCDSVGLITLSRAHFRCVDSHSEGAATYRGTSDHHIDQI